MTGTELIAQAKDLVIHALRHAPEGLTNSEVGRSTGLHVDVPNHPGFIQWTLLQSLMLEGKVRKEGKGPGAHYFIQP